MKLNFRVHGSGDESVGIWPSEAVITVDDNFRDSEREDSIKQWKELLRDYYDIPESRCRHYEGVWTEEEYNKILDDEYAEMKSQEVKQ